MSNITTQWYSISYVMECIANQIWRYNINGDDGTEQNTSKTVEPKIIQLEAYRNLPQRLEKSIQP